MTRPEVLLEYLEAELCNIPIEHWGFFYPCHVGVWRFIGDTWPGILGELQSGFDEEPYFRGKGSEWFCDTLGNDEAYLEAVERIMTLVVDGVSSGAKDRGFVAVEELPELPMEAVARLLSAVQAQVDAAL